MIPSKIDILAQAEQHFDAARFMPTTSTHFPNYVYARIVKTVPDLLNPTEYDCLHMLHERLRIIDASMDGLEERFNNITATHSIGQASVAVSGAVRDMSEALKQSRALAESLLEGKPTDVYQLGSGT